MEHVLSASLHKGCKTEIRNASEGFGEPKVRANTRNFDLSNLESKSVEGFREKHSRVEQLFSRRPLRGLVTGSRSHRI